MCMYLRIILLFYSQQVNVCMYIQFVYKNVYMFRIFVGMDECNKCMYSYLQCVCMYTSCVCTFIDVCIFTVYVCIYTIRRLLCMYVPCKCMYGCCRYICMYQRFVYIYVCMYAQCISVQLLIHTSSQVCICVLHIYIRRYIAYICNSIGMLVNTGSVCQHAGLCVKPVLLTPSSDGCCHYIFISLWRGYIVRV